MEVEVRKTAIDVVGNVPWGTHFCQFYRTKEDLVDILVPYFKAGLENNEFCMWVTSEPLNAEDAHKALKMEVRNLDDHIEKGQIEILDYSQWYTKPGGFDADEVLQGWIEKEKQALEKGFDGLRFTGNTFWLEKSDWGKFTNYEATVNEVIGKYRMLGICTYSLDKCTASEIIDVVSNHQFALVRQDGEWKTIESLEHKKADEVLKLHETRLQALLDLNKMAGASQKEILDFVREEVIKVTQSQFAFMGLMNEDESVMSMDNWSRETMAQCAIVDKPIDFTIAEAGLWGEPVRQRKPVVVNDYDAPHPAKKGYPQGHVPIERFLGIPVFDGERIVAVAAVANKVNDYDESDVRAVTSMMNDTWRLIRRKRAEEELQKSEANYREIFNSANDAIFVHDIESAKILSVNEKACQMYGYTQGEFEGLTVEDISTGVPPQTQENALRWIKKAVDEGPQLFEWICKHKTGREFWVEVNLRPAVIEGRKRMLAIVRDVTDRKDIEAHQQLAGQILECLNRESAGAHLIRDVLRLIKKATGLAAVAIRQREGKDFPYLEVDGFPDDFVKAENYLCCHNEAGELIHDSEGRPVIECMCGNVLSGRADPTLPFFTEGGSFWTNSTTELLVCAPPEALQVPTRNYCNQAGYESVALIPLRSADEIVGLLQLNDTRRERFTPEMIRFFEEIGASIGIGMARIRAEREVENLAKFPSENPNPILRVAKDGQLIYANDASKSLLAEWDCAVGEIVPDRWCQIVSEAFSSGWGKKLEMEVAGRTLSFVVVPVTSAGYANLYARDISERKQAEQELHMKNRIAEVFLTVDDDRMYGEVLEILREALVSEYGFFGYVDQAGSLVCPSLTRDIWDRCRMADKTIVFARETWGDSIWGKAITTGKSQLSNAPRKPPEGHVNIDRVLNVPIVYKANSIGIITLANKPADYTTGDQKLLESVADFIAPVLQARLQRKQDVEEIESLARFPSENPCPVLRIAKDGMVLHANAAGSELLGSWDCKVGEQAPEHWRQHIFRVLESGLSEELEG
jgi:PAS domain S-box-containing protein